MLVLLINIFGLVEVATDRVAHKKEECDYQDCQDDVDCGLTYILNHLLYSIKLISSNSIIIMSLEYETI